ncbi:MAG TPA: beta-propeller domain-containing protein [Solirubrobacteraceae bacterium]|nr:beta-propeller domain-containing protein [Solirubrobacteraceae bacterium]
MRARTLLVVLLAVLTAVTALAPATQARSRKDPRLRQFKSCPSLIAYGLQHYRKVARRQGSGPPPAARPMPAMGGAEAGGDAARPMPAAAPQAGSDYSTTNVQEAGIDEPDIVKTDGSTVFAVAGRTLRAVDVRGTSPRLADTLALGGWGAEILLEGDRLLVAYQKADASYAQSGQSAPAMSPPMSSYQPTTVLAEVDVSDPAALRVLRTMTVDGTLVSSRLKGSEARVVLATTPRALTDRPQGAGASAASARGRASRVNRRRAKAWLPSAVFRNKARGTRKRRALTHCRQTRRPKSFAGLDMLTVLTIDLRKGLEPVDSDSLMTSGETVYASGRSLYVATQKFMPELWSANPDEIPSTVTTEIHKFDISGAGETRYRGSGRVAGWLLSQFSMSEHKGVLRVASTSQPPWVAGDDPTQSYVTTLAERDGALAQLGRVGGMGRGERIYAVRFIDDVGYVVTFRQVDPLYTVDVSDPAQPKVVGELKVAGYSAYLHPAGEDLLIGVGQDATEEGWRTGTQISLFDVSNPAAPARLQHVSLGGHASSEAEYDHHAFLWWPALNLAVLPVSIYGGGGGPEPQSGTEQDEPEPFTGAIGFNVARERIREAGRVTHSSERYGPPIRRSLVVGDHLLTLSDSGLKTSRLDTFADVAWVPFG